MCPRRRHDGARRRTGGANRSGDGREFRGCPAIEAVLRDAFRTHNGTKLADDRFTWESANRTLDGDPQPGIGAERPQAGSRPSQRPQDRANWTDRSQGRNQTWNERVNNRSESWQRRARSRRHAAQGAGTQPRSAARHADPGEIRSIMELAMPCLGFIHS